MVRIPDTYQEAINIEVIVDKKRYWNGNECFRVPAGLLTKTDKIKTSIKPRSLDEISLITHLDLR